MQEDSVIRKFRITAEDGKTYNTNHFDIFLAADDQAVLQDTGKITAAIAKAHAETEFEKFRIIQDRLFMSDFDKYLQELEERAKADDDL